MQHVVLYDGEVTLAFDEERHQYWLGEELIFSPSAALNCIDKPGLNIWKIKQGVKAFMESCPPGFVIDEKNVEYIADRIMWAHKDKGAMTVGKATHLFCEKYARYRAGEGDKPPRPVNEEVWNACQAFLQWFGDRKVRPISTEQILYSRQFRYAGTADLLCTLDGEDDVWLIDYKTSSGVWNEYRAQVSAYTHAYEEEFGVRPRRGVVLFNKDTGLPKHHDLDAAGTSHEEDLAGFLHAMGVKKWQELVKNSR